MCYISYLHTYLMYSRKDQVTAKPLLSVMSAIPKAVIKCLSPKEEGMEVETKLNTS